VFWLVATSCLLCVFIVAVREERREIESLNLALSILLMVREAQCRDHARHARSLAVRPRRGPLVVPGARPLPSASSAERLERARTSNPGFPHLAGQSVTTWPSDTD